MTYSPSAEALLISPDHEPGSADRVASIVRRWHLGEHRTIPWPTCHLQPCDAVRREMRHENRSPDPGAAPIQLNRTAFLEAVAAAQQPDEPTTDTMKERP